MNCRRGDVVLVLFPDSNLRTSKRRPALVVQADGSGGERASGLLMDSVIMTDNLVTVHYSEIDFRHRHFHRDE
jgi:mRNA interferase MazF